MEEMLRSVLDTIGEGVIFQEDSGAIKYFNQAAQRIFGITEDEAKLRTSLHSEWHLVYEDGSPCPGEEHPSMITLRTGQSLNDQILGIAKPGQPVVWLSINTRPIFRPGQELPQAVVISFNDITKLKQAENRLRMNTDRYHDIANAHAGVIWEMDGNFVVTLLSGGVDEVMGYKPEEIIGRNPFFLIDPEDRERVNSVMVRLPQNGKQVVNIEYWARHKDGRRVRISTSCVSFFAQDGSFLGSRGTHLDITEVYWARRRRDIIIQLHKMSSESDAAISALLCKVCSEFTDSPMAFFGLMEPDDSAMIAHVWSPQAMAECRISDKPLRFPIESAGFWADPVRRREPVIVNDYASYQFKRGLPDDHVPITRYLGVPIVEGGKVIAVAGAANRPAEYGDRHIQRLRLVLSLIADFLSMRRKEKALREREEAYRTLVGGLPDIVMRFDREGRHLFVSQNVRKVVDIEASAFIGKTHAELGFPEAQCRLWEKAIRKVFDSGDTFETEFAYEGKAGTVIFNWRLVPERNSEGAISSVLSISRDITSYRKAEQEYKTLFREMLNGFALHEIICDEKGNPRDYRYLDVNPAFERMTGLAAEGVVGRTVLELMPETEPYWIETYGKVALSGEPIFFENYSNELGKYFEVTSFRTVPGQFACIFQDITERKLAEEALRESEERNRHILYSAMDGFWRVDAQLRLMEVNDAYCRMSGYSREDLLAMRVPDLEAQETTDEVSDRAEQLIENGFNRFTSRHRRKDGSLMDVEVSIAYMPGGGRGEFAVFLRDITERLHTERELRVSEEKFAKAFMHGPMLMTISDMEDGALLEVNDAFCRISGFSREESIGRRSTELGWLTESQREYLKAQLAANGNLKEMELAVHGKHGESLEVLLNAEVISVDKKRLLLATAIDITDRKLAERALVSSEQHLQTILKACADPLVVYDGTGETVFVNPSFTRIFGWEPEEVYGRRIPFVPEDQQSLTQEVIRQLYQTGNAVSLTTKRQTKDGRLLDIVVSAAGIPDATGKLSGMVVNLTDVTHTKQLETQLHQAQKMEALGTLAGGVAHDFNNILGAVQGFAEMARDDARDGRTDPRDLEQIIASVQRAKKLIKQILLFSRKNEPSMQPVNLNQSVNQVERILERTLPKMIAIETVLAPKLPPVQADPTQIEQVLLNLTSNAADAMPDGGRLTLATCVKKADGDFRQIYPEIPLGEYVLLTVSDTGLGMDQETREHIFEPFFTTKEIGKGTGLGLSTAYGIFKNHGGFIYCDSAPGQGTTFSLYLPLITQEQPESNTEARPEQVVASTGTETVLLVDDEDALRAVAGRMLRGAGYRVLEASSGEEALKTYAEQLSFPDLVITDLGMPGMGGHKAMVELIARYPGAKVIIASGYGSKNLVKTSMEAGAIAFVAKPFNKAELLSTVRKVLDNR